MQELQKVQRVARDQSTAPVKTLLVMDATTGQNGLAQARAFDEALDLDGIVLTKLDGTAKRRHRRSASRASSASRSCASVSARRSTICKPFDADGVRAGADGHAMTPHVLDPDAPYDTPPREIGPDGLTDDQRIANHLAWRLLAPLSVFLVALVLVFFVLLRDSVGVGPVDAADAATAATAC